MRRKLAISINKYISKINQFILKRYPLLCGSGIFIWICKAWLETKKIYINLNILPDKFWVGYRYFITYEMDDSYLGLLSIIISMLSVLMAALTIVFGSVKVCGINNGTIIKKQFRYQLLVCRITVMCSPFALIILEVCDYKEYFFWLFVFTVFNSIYLLHVCLSINLDIGIKYDLIPQYIFKEYKAQDFENGSIYKEFINNVNDEQIVEFNAIFEKVIEHVTESTDTQMNIYGEVYFIFKDLKESMYRNFGSNEDFLWRYFEICMETCNHIYERKTNSIVYCYLAIFHNLAECAKQIDMGDAEKKENFGYKVNYASELNHFFAQVLNCFNIEYDSELKQKNDLMNMLTGSLLTIELLLQQQQIHVENCFLEFIYCVIEKFVIDFAVLPKQNDFNQLENDLKCFGFVLFFNDEKYEKKYEFFMSAYKKIYHDLQIIIDAYEGASNKIEKNNDMEYASYTFLLYHISRARRKNHGK